MDYQEQEIKRVTEQALIGILPIHNPGDLEIVTGIVLSFTREELTTEDGSADNTTIYQIVRDWAFGENEEVSPRIEF